MQFLDCQVAVRFFVRRSCPGVRRVGIRGRERGAGVLAEQLAAAVLIGQPTFVEGSVRLR